MLHPTAIRSLLQIQPFRPFRIVLNSGRTYDVKHPEWVHVGKSWLQVFEPDEPGDEFPNRFQLISLMLMEHTEFIESKPMTGAAETSAV